MSLLEVLEQKRKEMMLTTKGHPRETELNKARGTTARTHNYCVKMGLQQTKDFKRVWRPPDFYRYRVKRFNY